MDVRGNQLCVLLLGALLVATPRAVQGEFILIVNLVNYTNPTGLCAECAAPLSNFESADLLVPVCCDDQPFTNTNCDNTGEGRCDTRFRWTTRPFGASLETRPLSELNADNPPYFFTDCAMSSTCPFSEMSTTFSQGPTALLGVTDNPLRISKPDFTMWMGQIQFFIEAVDSRLPNIIDSLLINLDNLQLGADFTEEMTFTGYHDISHMTMSFRVECSPGFCGSDCTTTPQNNPRVVTCQADGTLTCTDNRFDPSPFVACTDCLYNLDNTTGCSICVQTSYDPTTNCESCLDTNFNPSDGCTSCLLELYDLQTNCTQCLPNRDPSTNCTQCLPNRDPSTNCAQCLPGWDITSDCTSCLPNRDPSTDCSLCLQPDRFTDTDCSVCALPGGDPATLCQTCLATNFDPTTNCSECIGNRDLGSSCSTCLPGYDSSRDCTVCLSERNISTRCTTCLSGFTGSNCEPESAVSLALVAGIAGGVGGALFLVIIVLVIIVCVLMCQVRIRSHMKVNISGVAGHSNAYNLDEVRTGTGTGSSAEHKFQNPIYGPGLDSKPGTGTSSDHMFSNDMYESSKMQKQDTYSQLRHPSVSPSLHTVRMGTNEFASTLDGPTYDSANFPDSNHEITPVYMYDTLERQSPFSKEVTPQKERKESHSRVRKLTETSITLQPVPPIPTFNSVVVTDPDDQPVYDEAFLPNTDPSLEMKARHPSKSRVAYEEIRDGQMPGGSTYDTAFPTQPILQQDVIYDQLDEPNVDHPPPHIQTVLPPNETLYDDTVFLPKEQTPQPYAVLPPTSSAKPHPYDYIENPLDSMTSTSIPPQDKPVYTNTLPGKITPKALSHYDIGQ